MKTKSILLFLSFLSFNLLAAPLYILNQSTRDIDTVQLSWEDERGLQTRVLDQDFTILNCEQSRNQRYMSLKLFDLPLLQRNGMPSSEPTYSLNYLIERNFTGCPPTYFDGLISTPIYTLGVAPEGYRLVGEYYVLWGGDSVGRNSRHLLLLRKNGQLFGYTKYETYTGCYPTPCALNENLTLGINLDNYRSNQAPVVNSIQNTNPGNNIGPDGPLTLFHIGVITDNDLWDSFYNLRYRVIENNNGNISRVFKVWTKVEKSSGGYVNIDPAPFTEPTMLYKLLLEVIDGETTVSRPFTIQKACPLKHVWNPNMQMCVLIMRPRFPVIVN